MLFVVTFLAFLDDCSNTYLSCRPVVGRSEEGESDEEDDDEVEWVDCCIGKKFVQKGNTHFQASSLVSACCDVVGVMREYCKG